MPGKHSARIKHLTSGYYKKQKAVQIRFMPAPMYESLPDVVSGRDFSRYFPELTFRKHILNIFQTYILYSLIIPRGK